MKVKSIKFVAIICFVLTLSMMMLATSCTKKQDASDSSKVDVNSSQTQKGSNASNYSDSIDTGWTGDYTGSESDQKSNVNNKTSSNNNSPNKPNTTKKNNVSNNKTSKNTKSSENIPGGPNVITGKIDTTKYNLYTWSRPMWKGNTVYNESVYPMTTESGDNEVIQLLYDATKVLEVRSSDLKTLYKQGKDYKLTNGKIVIPNNSSIKVNKYEEYYPKESIDGMTQERTGGGYLFFSEGAVFHNKQIAVTYEHNGKWGGPVPKSKKSQLPGLQKQLKENGSINLVVFGDSISCGANASATVNTSPNTPSWPDLFRDAIKEMGVSVQFNNPSVGGEASAYGCDPKNIATVNRQSPDLVVLGWGMNDGGFWHGTSRNAYKANIKSAIDQIRAKNPQTEFILVGTMWPNPEARLFHNLGAFQQYTNQLYEIEKEYTGVAVASMTEIHKYIMGRKNYRDISGNNINHPNDFITRMYLQVLMATALE